MRGDVFSCVGIGGVILRYVMWVYLSSLSTGAAVLTCTQEKTPWEGVLKTHGNEGTVGKK